MPVAATAGAPAAAPAVASAAALAAGVAPLNCICCYVADAAAVHAGACAAATDTVVGRDAGQQWSVHVM